MNANFKNNSHSNFLYLIIFWLIITFLNLNKAFHIDDTAYLEVAKWIEQNPTRPMSNPIEWSDKPNFNINASLVHPPLFLYLIAGWGKIFSFSETSLHLLMSIFTFWIIFRFNNILELLNKPNKIYSILALSFCPAFILGHNIMLDIPLLALLLEFTYWILNYNCSSKKSFLLSSVFISISILIKYTGAFLIGNLIIKILFKKKLINIFWLLIPISTVLLWSLFNLYDVGDIHLLMLPSKPIWFYKYFESFVGFFLVFGCISPFLSILLYDKYNINKNPYKKIFIAILILISILVPVLIVLNILLSINEILINKIFFVVFFVNGVVIFYLLFEQILKKIVNLDIYLNDVYLIYWIASLSFVSIFLAPFLASRHLILIYPAILLIFNFKFIEFKNKKNIYLLLIFLNIIPSITYVFSDNSYAYIYKKYAKIIANEIGTNEKIWFNGTWGWKYYAEKNRMNYLTQNSQTSKGEYLVIPENVSGSIVPENISLELIKEFSVDRVKFFDNYSTIWFYSYFPFYDNYPKFYTLEKIEKFKIYKFN